jgi:hypothetical protein
MQNRDFYMNRSYQWMRQNSIKKEHIIIKKMDTFPELFNRAWRLDVHLIDDTGSPCILRNYIGRVDDRIYLHWRSGSYQSPFILSNVKYIQKGICRALLSALHLQELSQIASSRSTEYSVQFSLFDFRSMEVPMTSKKIIVDPEDDYAAILNDLSAEMSTMVDVYKAVDFDQRCIIADRANSNFQSGSRVSREPESP